jgi:hypothetical protein
LQFRKDDSAAAGSVLRSCGSFLLKGLTYQVDG